MRCDAGLFFVNCSDLTLLVRKKCRDSPPLHDHGGQTLPCARLGTPYLPYVVDGSAVVLLCSHFDCRTVWTGQRLSAQSWLSLYAARVVITEIWVNRGWNVLSLPPQSLLLLFCGQPSEQKIARRPNGISLDREECPVRDEFDVRVGPLWLAKTRLQGDGHKVDFNLNVSSRHNIVCVFFILYRSYLHEIANQTLNATLCRTWVFSAFV